MRTRILTPEQEQRRLDREACRTFTARRYGRYTDRLYEHAKMNEPVSNAGTVVSKTDDKDPAN